MGKEPHWYGWMIGAKASGQGMGRALLEHCFAIADKAGLPIFLETATETNISLYNAKEFDVKDSIRISDDCTIYFMVRPPAKVRIVAHQSRQSVYEQKSIH